MSVSSGMYACEKCRCTGYLARQDGLWTDGSPSTSPGWITAPSRKCQWCGHKEKVHTVYRPPPAIYGAIATYVNETGLNFAALHARDSQAEVEEELLRCCTVDRGGWDAAVRIQDSGKYLAIARSSDGERLGWASDYIRVTAERLAAKNCGDRKNPWVFSIHAKDGDAHNHYSGEPYCK
jgi:hypothetical protein